MVVGKVSTDFSINEKDVCPSICKELVFFVYFDRTISQNQTPASTVDFEMRLPVDILNPMPSHQALYQFVKRTVILPPDLRCKVQAEFSIKSETREKLP